MKLFQGARFRRAMSQALNVQQDWLKGALAALVLIGATQAQAAFTQIGSPATSEDGHAAIFSHVYGGTFTSIGGPSGVSYTNGTIIAERVDDDFDTVFHTSGFGATAKAVFANYRQSFGYIAGGDEPTHNLVSTSASSNDFVELFDVVNRRYNAQGEAEDVVIDGSFRFARHGTSGAFVTSRPGDNPHAADHLVTYAIRSVTRQPTILATDSSVLMLFFEDTAGTKSDRDFQDLVVEVRGASVGAREVVPEPVTAALAVVGMGALALRRSRS